MGPAIHRVENLKWQDGPASLPPGAKIAVLDGDPNKPGPFVMRFKFPDGYRVAPHTHPKPERVTVISGVLMIGMGDKFDLAKAEPMPAGTFGTWPAGMKHFGWFKGETVIQLQATGRGRSTTSTRPTTRGIRSDRSRPVVPRAERD